MAENGIILVIDDEAAQREIVRTALEQHGYAVLEAGDGLAGLSVMETRGAEIDLVITDMVMPRIGGRELLWRMNEEYPATRVLLTSGMLDDATSSDDGRLRAAGFLPKPLAPADVVRKVGEILASRNSPALDRP